MTIEQLTVFTQETAESIKRLAQEIGYNYKPLTDEDIREMIASPNTFIFAARESSEMPIFGMITVLVYRIPYVKKAVIEDLIVDGAHRGQGIGSQLVKQALSQAIASKAAYVDFSSRPSRTESNSLYEKLGFKVRDTNVYRYVLDYGEI